VCACNHDRQLESPPGGGLDNFCDAIRYLFVSRTMMTPGKVAGEARGPWVTGTSHGPRRHVMRERGYSGRRECARTVSSEPRWPAHARTRPLQPMPLTDRRTGVQNRGPRGATRKPTALVRRRARIASHPPFRPSSALSLFSAAPASSCRTRPSGWF
jgi:uncharacterized MAPEG superfamily protein